MGFIDRAGREAPSGVLCAGNREARYRAASSVNLSGWKTGMGIKDIGEWR